MVQQTLWVSITPSQDGARRLELLKLRQAIEFECEVARQTEEMKQYALAQARATSSNIALPQRVAQFCTMGLHYRESQEGGDKVTTYAVLTISSKLPWEKPGAVEFGSTEGVEVLQMLPVNRDIIAKVIIQPQLEPITVTWNGMWAEIALIAERQVQRQESPDPEAHRADRLKVYRNSCDKLEKVVCALLRFIRMMKVYDLLRVREAIRKEWVIRQQGKAATTEITCSSIAATQQQEIPRELLGKKD